MPGIMIVSVSPDDKRTVAEYIKDMLAKQDPFAFMVAGTLKEAVIVGYCSLDDNINDGMKKIQERIVRGIRAG
jgi:hypothetical protein